MKKKICKGLLLFLMGLFLFCYASVFALSIYLYHAPTETIATGSDGVKTAITLQSDAAKVVKLWGGVNQGDASTSFDIIFYSDNVAATEQEDILYQVNNITTEYLIDDTPFYLIATGTTDLTVYYMIHNDGTGSDFNINLAYEWAYSTSP